MTVPSDRAQQDVRLDLGTDERIGDLFSLRSNAFPHRKLFVFKDRRGPALPESASADQPALIGYTSGTTSDLHTGTNTRLDKSPISEGIERANAF